MADPEWLTRGLADGTIKETRCGPVEADRRFDGPLRNNMLEEEFQRQVIEYAQSRGWKVAHFRAVRVLRADGTTYWETPVQADGKGFPDLILLRAGVMAVVELKVGKNNPTAEQKEWLLAFRETGCASGVWRPEQWDTIRKVLA